MARIGGSRYFPQYPIKSPLKSPSVNIKVTACQKLHFLVFFFSVHPIMPRVRLQNKAEAIGMLQAGMSCASVVTCSGVTTLHHCVWTLNELTGCGTDQPPISACP